VTRIRERRARIADALVKNGIRAWGNYSTAQIAYTSSQIEIRRTEMTNAYRMLFVSNRGIAAEVTGLPARAASWLGSMLLGVGLTLAAAPASLAQSYDPSLGTGNIVPFYGQASQSTDPQGAWNEYARMVPRVARGARKQDRRIDLGAGMSGWNAYSDQGSMSGTDPDPNIRFHLNRESLQGRW